MVSVVWSVVCVVVAVAVVVVLCGTLKTPRVWIQHVPVCTFKTSPCMPALCAHVETHVRVVLVHTGGKEEVIVSSAYENLAT